ncbi:hypothetical protein CK203_095083 [Vitis vinifera]|uniref:K Homology domain-containing protein n=1 Tax=Vitis vinifera TaxID=29760 RepID=A0A438EWL8_VITVI|nr:hypothetical protein CK203_095083 [Vitis vinifera]
MPLTIQILLFLQRKMLSLGCITKLFQRRCMVRILKKQTKLLFGFLCINQIGCVIGKGGQIIQSIRSESGAQIRILKDDHLPSCSLSSNELIQISREPFIVRKILYQIASRLHDNPSRSQHLFVYVVPIGYSSSGSLMGLTSGAPIMV